MSACSSECNRPLLDAGVMGDGDQSVLVDPGQAADMVQPVSFCKQHKSEKKKEGLFKHRRSCQITIQRKSNIFLAQIFWFSL